MIKMGFSKVNNFKYLIQIKTTKKKQKTTNKTAIINHHVCIYVIGNERNIFWNYLI